MGSHTITAVYGGDNPFLGSTSKPALLMFLYDTTTILTSKPNPSTFGQIVTFTAQVKRQSPGSGSPPGILYGKRELLGYGHHEEDKTGDLIEPAIRGGGTVADTTYDFYSLLESPDRFEAGIQNYPGQIASGTAIQYLQQIGMDQIRAHETRLNSFLTQKLMQRYGNTGWFHIVGPPNAIQRGGLLTFEVKRPNAVGISEELNEKSNIMIRDGVFCAHAYFNQLFGLDWAHPKSHSEHRMVYRIFLYFYNTFEECNIFLDTLDEIFKERSYIYVWFKPRVKEKYRGRSSYQILSKIN